MTAAIQHPEASAQHQPRSGFIVRFRGLAVQFVETTGSLVFSLVPDDEATVFETELAAGEAIAFHPHLPQPLTTIEHLERDVTPAEPPMSDRLRLELVEKRLAILEQELHAPQPPNDEVEMVALILKRIAIAYRLTPTDLLKGCRMQILVWPRHLAMWLSHKTTSLSPRRLGELFRRDRGAITHGIQSVEDRMEIDPRTRAECEQWLKLFAALHPKELKNEN